jgi:aminoglycoside 2''-phosphotransferase
VLLLRELRRAPRQRDPLGVAPSPLFIETDNTARTYFYSVEPSQLISLIHRHTPFKVAEYRLLLEGWDNVVLLANGSHVFRFTRRPDVAKQLRKEAQLLPTLSEYLTLLVPAPEYVWMDGDPPYFMGYRAIPGEQLRASHMTDSNRGRVASSLAVFLTQLQGVPLGEVGDLVPRYTGGDWKGLYLGLREDAERRVTPRLLPETASRLLSDFDSYLGEPANFRFRPRLIHRDLSSDHILYDPATGDLTGIIDWGDSCAGDPAFDYTGLLADYGPVFTRDVQRLKADPDEYVERAWFYARHMGIYQVQYGLDVGDETHVEAGLRQLETVYL